MKQSVADALLAPHLSYYPQVYPLLEKYPIHAMAHITGGGLEGNLNRVLPPHLDARVDLASWEVPAVFDVLRRGGNVPNVEMFRTFNMGVGMVVIAPPEQVAAVVESAGRAGVHAWTLGGLVSGHGSVKLS